jgi:hypothetical protein
MNENRNEQEGAGRQFEADLAHFDTLSVTDRVAELQNKAENTKIPGVPENLPVAVERAAAECARVGLNLKKEAVARLSAPVRRTVETAQERLGRAA